MTRKLAALALLAALPFLGGCGSSQPGPTKELLVSSGGPPVLTTGERAAKEMETRRLPTVARATFESTEGGLDEPQLLKPFEQWSEQRAAADALGRIGAAAVPALIPPLQSQEPAVRLKAVEVLGRMGPEAQEAVPQLVKLLDDPDPAVRKATARTLGQIGPAARDAVPALMRTLLQPPPQPSPPQPSPSP